MKIIDELNKTARKLKKQITAVYYAGKHPGLPLRTKFLILFTIGYALSPVDLIPDFIPLLGYLDDLIILPLLLTLCIKSIPEPIMEDSLKTAERQPVTLKKNWKAGIVIILIWIFVIVKIIKALVTGR